MTTAERRRYFREWAARKRERELLERNRTSTTCQRRQGVGVCGGLLETTTDGTGRTVLVCPLCERRRRGLCRDCARPVEGQVGKAIRCAEHKLLAQRAAAQRSEQLHYEERLARARESYQSNPEVRARRNEYKRAYRKAHPEKVREYKRREALKQGRHRLEWHRRHNARKARKLKKRQQAMLAYYRAHPKRPQPKCAGCDRWLNWTPAPNGQNGAPPKWCDDCCPKYEKARRAKLGRSFTTLDAPPPVAYVPPLRELERAVGQPRTCVTPGCDIVVTGRKKKCSKCKAREAAEAARILAARAGRGRRVDLERAA